MLVLRNKFNKLQLALALLVAGFIAPPAFASGGGVDVSSVVTAIQATAAPIGLIGAAVLLILVAIKTYKWVRRAM
jgi:hypothetical protein